MPVSDDPRPTRPAQPAKQYRHELFLRIASAGGSAVAAAAVVAYIGVSFQRRFAELRAEREAIRQEGYVEGYAEAVHDHLEGKLGI